MTPDREGAPAGGPAGALSPDERRARIGWARAIATAALIVAVAFAAIVVAPNLVLTGAASLSRTTRGVAASAVSVVATFALAWGLRRLQAHGQV